ALSLACRTAREAAVALAAGSVRGDIPTDHRKHSCRARRIADMAAGFTSARFVGRERELARLAVALEQAANGRPTAVLVAGSSGIGVSRMLTEAQRRLAGLSEPFTVLRGQATA